MDASRRGVTALMKALYHLLSDHISREFPTIQAEIDANLEEARAELVGLGPSRKNDHEHAQYLISLASTYEKSVRASLSGQYSVNADTSSKLRTLIQNANDDFSHTMHKSGYFIPFHSSDKVMGATPFSNVFGKLSVNEPLGARSASPQPPNSMFIPEQEPPRSFPEDKKGLKIVPNYQVFSAEVSSDEVLLT